MEKMGGVVEFAKEMPGFLAVSWRRNVLLFPGAARIIGEKMRGGTAMICQYTMKTQMTAPIVSIFDIVVSVGR